MNSTKIITDAQSYSLIPRNKPPDTQYIFSRGANPAIHAIKMSVTPQATFPVFFPFLPHELHPIPRYTDLPPEANSKQQRHPRHVCWLSRGSLQQKSVGFANRCKLPYFSRNKGGVLIHLLATLVSRVLFNPFKMEPLVGIEPTTYSLRMNCYTCFWFL